MKDVALLKNVSIIGTAGVPAAYGGFETLVENLISFNNKEICYTVFCSGLRKKKRARKYKGAILKYIYLRPNGISSILYDLLSMFQSLKSDYMLILGVSGCIFLPLVRALYRGKIITNIDGIEWRRKKWNWFARLILRLSESIAVRFSDTIIGDNQGIINYVIESYGISAILIEYGGDRIGQIGDIISNELYPFIGKEYAVSVCRIEPENNIASILEAFSRFDEMFVVIVGNWNKSNYGRELIKRYTNNKHMFLLEPEYNRSRIDYIRSNASVYIHGHSAGGTNPSLVEAMSLGLPILAYDCVYNRSTTEDKCFYWKNSDDLYALLKREAWSDTAAAMKEIAERRYKWEVIAPKYEALFI